MFERTRCQSNFLVCFKFKPKRRKLERWWMFLLSNCVYTGVVIMFSPVSCSHWSWWRGRCWAMNFPRKKPQKWSIFPVQVGLCSWLLLFSWKLRSPKMSRIVLLWHGEAVWARLDGTGRCTKTYKQGHGKYERIGVSDKWIGQQAQTSLPNALSKWKEVFLMLFRY